MKNENELKEYNVFQPNECDSLKEYLEDMALKGWKLKNIDRYFYFEKIEPQKLQYLVDIIRKPNSYREDWDFICKKNDFNIYVTNKTDITPVEIDELEKLNYIKKTQIAIASCNSSEFNSN